jgi:cyclase
MQLRNSLSFRKLSYHRWSGSPLKGNCPRVERYCSGDGENVCSERGFVFNGLGMNRRDFLVRSSMFTAAGLLTRSIAAEKSGSATGAPVAGARPPTAPAPVTPEFKLLRREVGYFTAQGGTIGWLVNKDALACVDTQFARTAPLFLSGLPGRNDRKLDVVINSHHHPDHTGGNGVMKPATKKIVAHANVPALQRARADMDKKGDEQVYADTTFADTWRAELGGEVVSAKYHGVAHTKGDIVTLFEKANVIHMGDLMFNRIYPVIDRGGGGRIKGWIQVLEQVAKAYPADAIYIFGHANPKFSVSGKREDLLTFRDYLSGLLDYTQKKINAGEPKEKIVALENLPGFPDYHLPLPNRLGGNLGVAYDELTEKKG